jgi:hypothetical protein
MVTDIQSENEATCMVLGFFQARADYACALFVIKISTAGEAHVTILKITAVQFGVMHSYALKVHHVVTRSIIRAVMKIARSLSHA